MLCSTTVKSRAMVIFPALGIALGASCCLSVPLLVTVAAPSAAALSSSLWLYDATYFLFPPLAVVLLYGNLRSVEKIMANAMLKDRKSEINLSVTPSVRQLSESLNDSGVPVNGQSR